MLMRQDSPIPARKLQVDIVDTMSEFEALRPAWRRLYDRDVQSTVFLSWEWLEKAFRDNPLRWSVLVVRAPDQPEEAICILPLKYRVHWSQSQKKLQTQLEAGGRLVFSEYCGFLCDPVFEEQGLAAAARTLARLPWARLSMRYIAQPRRAQIFTDRLSALGLDVRYNDYRINKGQIDNLICPQVDLPEDFETYLATRISAKKRKRHASVMRRHFDTGEYRFEHASGETVERDIDGLLDLWKSSWAPEKGQEKAEQVAENYRQVLMTAHRCKALFLPKLYRGDDCLGALGHVLDRKNALVHFVIVGRDTGAEEPFIGEVLHLHSIAWAIERGFICYDFSHGNEAYKYSYGAEDLTTLYFEARRGVTDDAGHFDVLCLGEAMRRLHGYIRDGKHDRAETISAQLAELLS